MIVGSRARLRASVLNISKYYLEGEKIGKLIRSTSNLNFLYTLSLNALHNLKNPLPYANISAQARVRKAEGTASIDREPRGPKQPRGTCGPPGTKG